MATILGTIDQGGDGLTVLMALLNAKEGTNYSIDDFVFTLPEVPTESNPVRNTLIKLAPKATSGYYGVKTIYYNRIHLTELGQVIVAKGTAHTLVELLPAINSKYGVLIKSTDVVDYELPAVNTSQDIEVTLVFTASSVVFYGGDIISLEGDKTVAPFLLDTMLAGVNVTPIANSWMFLDSSKVDTFTIGLDVLGTLRQYNDNILDNNAITGTNLTAAAVSNSAVRNIENSIPFVHMWKNGLTALGITKTGLVLSTDGDGSIWALVEKIPAPSRILPGKETDPAYTLLCAYNDIFGSYAIVQHGTVYELYKGSVGGGGWTLSNVLASTMQVFKAGNTTLKPHAITVNSGVMSVITTGEGSVTVSSVVYPLPVVETLNLSTGIYTITSLGGITIGNSAITIGDPAATVSKLCFVTNSGAPGKFVAAYSLIKGTNTPSVVLFDLSHTTSTANFVSKGDVPFNSLDAGLGYVNSYSIPLTLATNGYLDVIEIPVAYKTATPDLGYFLEDNVVTDAQYTTFGVRVYSSIRVGTDRSIWKQTDFKLHEKYPSKSLTVYNTLANQQYTVQINKGITRSKFSWSNTEQNYVAERETVFNFESPHIYSVISGVAAGNVHPVTFVENPNGLYSDLYGNTLVVGTGFEYSFALNNGSGPNWAVGTNSSQQLLLSENFSYPNYFGGVPLAVFADFNAVYALLQNNRGIVKSLDGGVTWKGYAQSTIFGKRDSASANNNSNILSVTSVKLTPMHFVGGVVENGYLSTQITFNDALPVLGFNQGALVSSLPGVNVNVIAKYEDSTTTIRLRYPSSSSSTTTGVPGPNFLGDVEYAQIYTWACTTAPNVFEMFGNNINHGINGLSNIPLNAYTLSPTKVLTPVTATKRVKFLDLNYLSCGYEIVGAERKYWLVASRTTNGTTTPLSLSLLGGSNALATFAPTIAFHVWDSMEAKYMPYVFYGNKKFLLAGRLDNVDSFNFTLHMPTILADNGTDLIPIPMFNGNRQDYLFLQKGNGVFKLVYDYDPTTRLSHLTLARLFDISAWPMPYYDFASGAIRGKGNVTAPTEFELLSTPSTELTIPGFSFFDSGDSIAPTITGIYESEGPTITGIYVTPPAPAAATVVTTATNILAGSSIGFTTTLDNFVASTAYTLAITGNDTPIGNFTVTTDANGHLVYSGTATCPSNTGVGAYTLRTYVRGPNPASTLVATGNSNALNVYEPVVLPDVSNATVSYNQGTSEVGIGGAMSANGYFAQLPSYTLFIKKVFFRTTEGADVTAPGQFTLSSGAAARVSTSSTYIVNETTPVGSILSHVELWDEDDTAMLLTTPVLTYENTGV